MPDTRPSLRSANWLYLISMVLIISVGSFLQSRSLGWGLLATEFVLILLPVMLLIWLGRLNARTVLRLRWPGLRPVLLAAVIGAGVWGFDMGVQGLASALMGYAPASALASLPTDPLNLIVFAAGMVLAAPICEEAFFRGYLLSAYGRFRPVIAVLAVGVLFAVFHLQFQGVFALLPIALTLGYLANRTNSLAPGMAAHLANNSLGALLAIGMRLNPTLASQPALTTALCGAMLAGPVLALLALWAFHRLTRQPAIAPQDQAAPVMPAPVRPIGHGPAGRGTYWPLAAAGALYLFFAALEVIMGRFPQALAQSTLQLKPAPWTQPVTLAYNLFNVANDQVGQATCTLTPQGPAIAFHCTTWQKHFEVHQGSSTYAGGRYELMQAGRWEASSMHLLEAQVHFAGEYSGWAAQISPAVNGLSLALDQAAPTALPADVVLAAEWPWRMMALPFGQSGYFGSRLNLLHLGVGDETGQTDTSAVLMGAQEDLPTPPAGHRLAWKVTVGKQTAWYSAAAPHTLLRYNDGYGVTWTITSVSDDAKD